MFGGRSGLTCHRPAIERLLRGHAVRRVLGVRDRDPLEPRIGEIGQLLRCRRAGAGPRDQAAAAVHPCGAAIAPAGADHLLDELLVRRGVEKDRRTLLDLLREQAARAEVELGHEPGARRELLADLFERARQIRRGADPDPLGARGLLGTSAREQQRQERETQQHGPRVRGIVTICRAVTLM